MVPSALGDSSGHARGSGSGLGFGGLLAGSLSPPRSRVSSVSRVWGRRATRARSPTTSVTPPVAVSRSRRAALTCSTSISRSKVLRNSLVAFLSSPIVRPTVRPICGNLLGPNRSSARTKMKMISGPPRDPNTEFLRHVRTNVPEDREPTWPFADYFAPLRGSSPARCSARNSALADDDV